MTNESNHGRDAGSLRIRFHVPQVVLNYRTLSLLSRVVGLRAGDGGAISLSMEKIARGDAGRKEILRIDMCTRS
jgi:hypothetical protein